MGYRVSLTSLTKMSTVVNGRGSYQKFSGELAGSGDGPVRSSGLRGWRKEWPQQDHWALPVCSAFASECLGGAPAVPVLGADL